MKTNQVAAVACPIILTRFDTDNYYRYNSNLPEHQVNWIRS